MPIGLGHIHIVNFKITFLVYNQWHWPLHLFIFLPLLRLVCFSSSPPPLFLFVSDTGQQILFWQLSIDHNVDVPDKDVHYPVRYRLYVPWTPSYNTHHKSLTQKLKFSWKFLTLTLHTLVLTQMCPSPSPVLNHVYFGDHCNSQIYIGEGETHTSVLTLLTSIVLIPSQY